MAGSSKAKHDRHFTSEVNSARSKLDGVLQTLMIKSEDSSEHSESESTKEPDLFVAEPSLSSPKKLASKPPRKRRRKDDGGSNDSNSFHHTFVMKLFDRSVDLAQFGEEAPLYPVCRAWMHHHPQKQAIKSRSPSPELEPEEFSSTLDENKEETKFKEVYRLPPPLPKPLDENGQNIDVQIPSPVHYLHKPLSVPDALSQDPEFSPSREQLLENHMDRWKAIRQKWKEASHANEARYKESISVIKSLFER